MTIENNVNASSGILKTLSRRIQMQKLGISAQQAPQNTEDVFSENVLKSTSNDIPVETISLIPMTSEAQEVLDQYNINFNLTTATEIYIYDVSKLTDASGNKLGASKVVSYSDIYGDQRFEICLSDTKSKGLLDSSTSDIAITLKGANSRGVLDATTFKNTVGKAMLMITQTMETRKQISPDYCQNYGYELQYDATTKTANLDGLAKDLISLTDIFYDKINASEEDPLLNFEEYNDLAGELETYLMDLMDELL